MKRTRGLGQPGPRRWLGIGIRILATVFFLLLIVALNRCSLSGSPSPQTVTTPVVEIAHAWLRVEVQPKGSRVLVDGQIIGPSPLSVDLAPGQYKVRVELDGYEPLVQSVDLTADGEAVVSGELVPLPSKAPTFTPIASVTEIASSPLPDLAIRMVKIELETGGDCDYSSTQLGIRLVIENAGDTDAESFVVEVNGNQQRVDAGLAAGQTISLWFEGYTGENIAVVDATGQVEESNEDNNTFQGMIPIPTLPLPCTPVPAAPPTITPSPSPPPTDTPSAPRPPPTATPALPPPPPAAAVSVREGQVSIPTYPYAQFLVQARNEAYHMSYLALDRSAYEASNPGPTDVAYRTVVLENEYLRLTFLPEVGGRLYEVFFKPTGNRETYLNPVLKPSPWGPPEQNWWLAAGGIEWCFPVEEHGYEWGVPWVYDIHQDANGVTVTLSDSGADDRVGAKIAVRLEAGAAYFSIRPRLENPTGTPVEVKYWTNAMLAPGGHNAPSPDLHFVLPEAVSAVTIHSRGDDYLPDYGQRMPWPAFNGTDMSRLGNWNRWLGFFEDPATGEFIAVYDRGYDEGMVRLFPAHVARGVKVFGLGWNEPLPSSNWTDDNSSYVEIHGGPAPTFDRSVSLPAGEALEWTETWYPVAGLGGLRYANSEAAFNLAASNGQVRVAVAVPRAWSGDMSLLLNGQELWRQSTALIPGPALRQTISLPGDVPQTGRLTLRLERPGGGGSAEYSADFTLK